MGTHPSLSDTRMGPVIPAFPVFFANGDLGLREASTVHQGHPTQDEPAKPTTPLSVFTRLAERSLFLREG